MKARHLAGIGIAVACTAVAVFLFDWRQVATTLRDVKLGFLMGSTIVALAVASMLRGLRWLVVLGAQISPANIARSSFVNGAASRLAAITPVQVCEAVKIRHQPDMGADRWRFGVSAFLAERLLDLGGAIGVLLGGLPSLGIPAMGLIVAIYALVLISSLAGHEFNLKSVLILATVLAIGSYVAFIWALKLQMQVWPTFITG